MPAPPPLPPAGLPRRSSTVGQSVRRLARRLSSGVLRRGASTTGEHPQSRPESAASVRSDFTAVSAVRPQSKRGGKRSLFGGGGVPELAEEAESSGLQRVRTLPTQARAAEEKAADQEQARIVLPWDLPRAWAFKHGERMHYDVAALVHGQKVSELWFPSGDTLVFLCSEAESGRYRPSFKLSSGILQKKSEFFATAVSDRWQEGHRGQHATLLKREGAKHILYFPPSDELPSQSSNEDSRHVDSLEDFHSLVDQLVATRNFFAFLFDRFCVGLHDEKTNSVGGQPLSDLMERMEMYLLSPATEEPSEAASREAVLHKLEAWIRNNQLDDARNAPRRLIDVLVVSEQYQWEDIFTEAFIHGAGLFNAISASPHFPAIPHATRQLLERASFSIRERVSTTTGLLSAFKFPILQSSGTRVKRARPAENPLPGWRRAYRRFAADLVSYYTRRFNLRHWPPPVWSRGMAKQLQRDFAALFDLLVDHDSPSASSPSIPTDPDDPYRYALALALRDFEEAAFPSTAAAKAAVSFPRLPSLPSESSPAWGRKQTRDAIAVTLLDSYNAPGDAAAGNRFVEEFLEWFKRAERSYGEGRTVTKSVVAREGRWCLVYAVRRCLESVCAEWDGLRYTREVEYWLCAELRGVPPWKAAGVRGAGGRNVRETGGTGVWGRSQSRAE